MLLSTDDKSCDAVRLSESNRQLKSFLGPNSSKVWLLDSGALDILRIEESDSSAMPVMREKIRLGDDGVCSVRGIGSENSEVSQQLLVSVSD